MDREVRGADTDRLAEIVRTMTSDWIHRIDERIDALDCRVTSHIEWTSKHSERIADLLKRINNLENLHQPKPTHLRLPNPIRPEDV